MAYKILVDTIADIANAIRENIGAEQEVQPADSGGGEKPDGWSPPADWWDVKTMVNTSVVPWLSTPLANVRYGFVLGNTWKDDNITLPAGYEYYLSDGGHYANGGTHIWDRSKDKPCSAGYNTRAVIVCSTSANVSVELSTTFDLLYVYFGQCNITKCAVSDGGHVCQYKGVEFSENTTTSNNAFDGLYLSCGRYYRITIPATATIMGNLLFSQSTTLSSVTFLGNITSISANAFYACHSLNAIIVQPGFNVSVNISSSNFLSISGMENLINNYADRTSQTALTLTLGSLNLNKLDSSIKAVATAKNITLA